VTTLPEPDAARLTRILAACGVNRDRVAGHHPLDGGTFNTVYLSRLVDGSGLVVKIAPDPREPVLAYEKGILATEAEYYRLAAAYPDVSVPSLVHLDLGDAIVPGGFLVMSECPGTPWPRIRKRLTEPQTTAMRTELGRQVARLHTITGPGFGYPAESVGPLRPSWRAAFTDMVEAILRDARRFAAELPRPAAEVGELFAALTPVLDAVTVPALVHFDLWDGNILVDPATGRLGGMIDAERALWGDPLAEFVSLALFGDIRDDPAFLQGYRAAGGSATFDDAALLRLSLYRAYLYLIMWVEIAPRHFDASERARRRARVFEPLAETLRTWSTLV
jgi:aminoglycoside phosphotransferase (APT) family kinase protein